MLKLLLVTLAILSSLSVSEGLFFGGGSGTCPAANRNFVNIDLGAIANLLCIPCTTDANCFGLLCCPTGTGTTARNCCKLPTKSLNLG